MVLTTNIKHTQNGTWKHINMQEFVCGWSASFINISVTYPVYKIMFRQVSFAMIFFKLLKILSKFVFHIYSTKKTNFVCVAFQMLHGVEMKSAIQELRSEGFTFLYRGILPPLAQRTVSLSLMFGLYDGTKRPLIQAGVNEYVAKCIAGLSAGMQNHEIFQKID